MAHLRENELRGNLSFIDKAHAVLAVKKELASELNDPDISQRRLARLLTDRGLSVSHSLISKMMYAVERLLPVIPQALAAGESESGCTVHLVDAGIDTGRILAQATVPILPGDTGDGLYARIREQEHRLLAQRRQRVGRADPHAARRR